MSRKMVSGLVATMKNYQFLASLLRLLSLTIWGREMNSIPTIEPGAILRIHNMRVEEIRVGVMDGRVYRYIFRFLFLKMNCYFDNLFFGLCLVGYYLNGELGHY